MVIASAVSQLHVPSAGQPGRYDLLCDQFGHWSYLVAMTAAATGAGDTVAAATDAGNGFWDVVDGAIQVARKALDSLLGG